MLKLRAPCSMLAQGVQILPEIRQRLDYVIKFRSFLVEKVAPTVGDLVLRHSTGDLVAQIVYWPSLRRPQP